MYTNSLIKHNQEHDGSLYELSRIPELNYVPNITTALQAVKGHQQNEQVSDIYGLSILRQQGRLVVKDPANATNNGSQPNWDAKQKQRERIHVGQMKPVS